MSKIVFAWELGANYGHLMRQLPLAQSLRARGHDVWFAVCDLRIAHTLLGPHGFPFVANPRLTPPQPRSRAPVSYSQILGQYAYADVSALHPLTDAWVNLLRALEPWVLVADYAPTALLASRILRVPSVCIAAPFSIPPLVDPLPSIRPWDNILPAALEQADREVLMTINAVLAAHKCTPLTHVAELFADSVNLITTFRELDFYTQRSQAAYLGPLIAKSTHPQVHWTWGTDRKRVFAYLRPSIPGFEQLIEATRRLPIDLICVVAGAPDPLIEQLRARGITARNSAVDLPSLLPECDLVIHYAGAGVIAQSLVHGVPLLLVPQMIEQRLNALRAANLGVAISVDDKKTTESFARAASELLFDSRYRRNALAFKEKYSTFDSTQAVALGVQSILQAGGVTGNDEVLSNACSAAK